jgi:hypothetical protein
MYIMSTLARRFVAGVAVMGKTCSRARAVCARPEHVGSGVRFDGHYGKSGHRCQLYRCVPANGDPPHRFTELLPREEAWHDACEACEHRVHLHEGPHAARHYQVVARGIAEALVAVGAGATYRQRRLVARARARRLRADPETGEPRMTRHGQLGRGVRSGRLRVPPGVGLAPRRLAAAGRPALLRARPRDRPLPDRVQGPCQSWTRPGCAPPRGVGPRPLARSQSVLKPPQFGVKSRKSWHSRARPRNPCLQATCSRLPAPMLCLPCRRSWVRIPSAASPDQALQSLKQRLECPARSGRREQFSRRVHFGPQSLATRIDREASWSVQPGTRSSASTAAPPMSSTC